MKALLLFPDGGLDVDRKLNAHQHALIEDLGLDTVLDAMAGEDPFLRSVAEVAVLTPLTEPDDVIYRQLILQDCLRHRDVVEQIYDLAVEATVEEKKIYRGFLMYSSEIILHRSVDVLNMFLGVLRRLRDLARTNAAGFQSSGFTQLFAMLSAELDDDYFALIADHLRRLRFKDGVLISAALGAGNKGVDYTLRKHREQNEGLLTRLSGKGEPAFTLTIPDRDEAGARALGELRDRGVNLVANALAQSTDHILNFFAMLRAETGFYLGCLNLHDAIAQKNAPVCFPQPSPVDSRTFQARGLYDVGLALRIDEPVIGNDVCSDERSLVMITGANQGGKSTFLRSVGLAQLMMQCGMFVPAQEFDAHLATGIFTHFKREEDATMTSGKFDEELSRMSAIADSIGPNGLLLCNESFAATNEREGSEIARQVLHAFLDSNVAIFFVTHLFDLADSVRDERADSTLFLRAERNPDGERTFRLVEGEPLSTSFGRDLYERIFDRTPDRA